MGYANDLIEKQTGSVSLFMNADAGDIDPAPVCIMLITYYDKNRECVTEFLILRDLVLLLKPLLLREPSW